MCPSIEKALQQCIKEDLYLETWTVHKTAGLNLKTPVEGAMSLTPVIDTLRKGRYIHIGKLLVWNFGVDDAATIAMADLLGQGSYIIKRLELIDCLLIQMGYAFTRLIQSFTKCESLTTILLDYNMFGDPGCEELCEAMCENTHILVLSLKYCGITYKSGLCLADVIKRTRLQELYLDGNVLTHSGAMDILSPLVEQINTELYMKEELQRLQQQQEEQQYVIATPTNGAPPPPKKGKKKKKEPPGPPPIGPWLAKLSLKANDIHVISHDTDPSPFECVQMCARLVAGSETLKDLDFRDNHIGEAGAKQFSLALEERIQGRIRAGSI
ncbi:hypothetical protein NP493_399g01005 [Ridgeia piscesae]|uniref:Uncharacterized protein n=1 Tax=Ridgeia piscesae TaxID=27915 RepID=A0AAD9L299_RIDPI|nr:hypothetical protein NP493_399g01005 [Ridgeia piscesae]